MSQNINIRLSSNVVQLSPGEGTVLAVTIINNGRGVERLELSVNNIDPGWLLLDQTELLLYPDAPGNEGTVNLQVSLPITALPGSYSPTIDIRNAGEIDVSASAQLVLVVNQLAAAPGPEFALLQEAVQTKHKWARFQLQVNNPLDLPQTLKLYGRPSLPSTRLRIIPPVVEMPPRGQAISIIELEPAKRNRIRPGKRYDFMVAAENAPGQANGYMVQTAALPFLAKILATPFLLVMSLLLPVLIMGGVIAFILLSKPSTPTTQNVQTVARCVNTNLAQTASLRMGAVNTDIIVTDADTGKIRKIQQEPVERLPGLYSSLLSVSPDGKQLAYVTAANEAMDDAVIYTVNTTSGSKQRVAGVPSGFWPTHPIWSNGSDQLGYVVRNGSQLDFNAVGLTDKKVTTYPIAQMVPSMFYDDPGTAGPLCFSTDNTRIVVATKVATVQTTINLADRSVKVENKPTTALGNSDKSFAPNSAAAVEPGLAPLGDSACAVSTFSQNDPLWRDLNLKGPTDAASDKIGAAGCALTSAAMMLNYFKVQTDPNELNACMGTDASALNWNWVKPAQNCSNSLVAGAQRDYFSWDGLNQSLSQGQPAVVGLLGGQTGTHFVVVVGGTDSIASTYRVNDPWDGTNNKSLSWFINRGYQLQWLVTFTGANPPVCKTRVTTLAESNPNLTLKITSPEDGLAYGQPVSIAFTGGTDRTTATLYPVVASAGNATPATAATGPDGASLTPGATVPTDQTSDQSVAANGQVVQNGQQVTGEGAYQLVLDSPGDTGVVQRLSSNFVVDLSAPTLTRTVQGAFESNLSATGAQVAHGNVTMQLKATDRLSGIAAIEYVINGGSPQPYTNDVNPKAVTFSNAGEYDVTYKATDGAGNVTQTQEWKFSIVVNNNDLGPNGNGNGTTTPTPSVTAVVTTPPPASGNNGTGNGTGNGNGDGSGGGDATTAAPTTVPVPTTAAPTTVAVPPALIVAAPNQLAFDATMENTIVPINLTNSGGQAANITIQPPTGPAAGFLKFQAITGTVPAAGALPVQVQLGALNYSAQPVQGSFNIVYNGITLPVTFSVAPQPAPTVAFTSPASGPVSKTVTIKMAVTTTGAGKPNHINVSAKYLDKIGGATEERLLSGQANASNSWTYNWDINSLPPQQNMEIHATLCWSVDETNCFKVDSSVTGLTIPNPSAAIALDPNSATLNGTVNIVATPGGGPLDHITYSYIYKKDGSDVGPITITDKANASNQYKVAWDTSSIPPQENAGDIKLNAKVCATGADSDDTCFAPSAIAPTGLTKDKPTIAAAALAEADAKNLPLTVKLNGTIAKLTNPSATVWVNYSISKVYNGPATEITAPATMSDITNGTALWSASIDTSNLPPQTINFVPKICWDGNPTGNYCYTVAVPVVGVIPEITPAFADPKPADLSTAAVFSVTTTPAGRASIVKFLITYTKFDGKTVTDAIVPTIEANKANKFQVTFDSVALGLAPGQTVQFKLQACNDSGYCSAVTAATPLAIPASTLALTPTAESLQSAPLTSTIVLNGILSGRNITSLQINTIYNDSRYAQNGAYTRPSGPYLGIKVGTTPSNPPFPISLDTSDIPPQTGISIQYKLCWQGTLDSGCAATVTAYSGLTKEAPGIARVILNGPAEYNPAGDKVLPIPYNSVITNTTINLPITAVVTDPKISSIKWQLKGVSSNSSFSVDLANTAVSNLQAVSTLQFNVAQLITNTNQGEAIDFNLVASPVWQGVYTITDTTKIKVEPVKMVSYSVNLKGANVSNKVGPFSADTTQTEAYKTNATMISSSTEISLTDFPAQNPVKRANYYVSYNIGSTAPPNTSAQLNTPITTPSTSPASQLVGVAASNFKVTWNHATDLPKILPQSGIILSWRFCNTDVGDDSGCLPLNTTNSFNQVGNLTLAGVKFNPDPSNPSVAATNVNSGILDINRKFFNSTFDAYVKVVGGPAIHTVRFIAFPKIGGSMTAAAAKDSAVILSTHEDPTASTDGTWHANLYFASPDTPSGNNTQGTKLLAALANTHMDMTLAVQMCAGGDLTGIDDPKCSDWTGATESLVDSTSTAQINAKLAIMVVWKPMCTYTAFGSPTDVATCGNPTSSTSDPYNQYIQDISNTDIPTRTLTLKIYKVQNAANTTVYNAGNSQNLINTGYFLTGTSNVIATTPISCNDCVSTGAITTTVSTYFVRRDWNVRGLTLPVDPTTGNTNTVNLKADVSFDIDATLDQTGNLTSNNYTVSATVPTHGRNAGYCPPTGTCTVITTVTTPASTTAPATTVAPTTSAPTTSAPTTAPSTTAPTTSAPTTTEPSTTVVVPSTSAVTTPPTTPPPTTTTPPGSGNSPGSA